MSPQEAAKILTEHNRWRRGQAPFETGAEMPHTGEVVGQAIDTAIEFIRTREAITGHKARNPVTSRKVLA